MNNYKENARLIAELLLAYAYRSIRKGNYTAARNDIADARVWMARMV
jgi:hypothetical protein